MEPIAGFWIMAPDRLLAVLDATPQGIAAPEVKRRPASLGRPEALRATARRHKATRGVFADFVRSRRTRCLDRPGGGIKVAMDMCRTMGKTCVGYVDHAWGLK